MIDPPPACGRGKGRAWESAPMGVRPSPGPSRKREGSMPDLFTLAITPATHDLGGFKVRRTLPSGPRTMVGPFIFVDQFGPAQLDPGQGMDVRPHPHINLATVT